MSSFERRKNEINHILASDIRFGKVNPDNDQIWELTTSKGEPTALALQTTYGLRVCGLKIFPRFSLNRLPFSDPNDFASFPSIDFFAPNFASIKYQPIETIDVNQKVWVPNSQSIIGQITLTNLSHQPVSLGMEWIVQLTPLHTGSQMKPVQMSVNTILQGHAQNLHPVFFLTGGPHSYSSAYPNLSIDIVFTPGSSREFTWVLSSLDTTEESFYAARSLSTHNLDLEQMKIQMLEKNEKVSFEFENDEWTKRIHQSQVRVDQLLMPEHHEFFHLSFVNDRNPDLGYSNQDEKIISSNQWGVLNFLDLWELSYLLLPGRATEIKQILLNFFDQQSDNGVLGAQINWNNTHTELLAPPLIASFITRLLPYIDDQNWLTQIYPSLIRYLKNWFTFENDYDQDGFPEWRHLVQMGGNEFSCFGQKELRDIEVMIHSAEWTTLVCMLITECKNLLTLAKELGKESDIEWLNAKNDLLQKIMSETYQTKKRISFFRDKTTHQTTKGKVFKTYIQDGIKKLNIKMNSPGRIFIEVNFQDGIQKPVQCEILTQDLGGEKTLSFTSKNFTWIGGTGIVVSDQLTTEIIEIYIKGLTKGDTLKIGIPDFTKQDPTFMIIIWANVLPKEYASQLIKQGKTILDSEGVKLPLFLKIMWVEGLINYGEVELACYYFKNWYLSDIDDLPSIKPYSKSVLNDLIPTNQLLNLLGIQKITDSELLINKFNEHFSKVNVQYRKVKITLESSQTRINQLNGESIIISDPNPHRILLS